MNPEVQSPVPPPASEPARYSVPWKPIDNWIGVALLVLIDGALFAIYQQGQRGQLAQSWLLVIVQITFLLPVVIIFAYRRINWRALGFGKSDWGTLGIGCACLLMASYAIILVHKLR